MLAQENIIELVELILDRRDLDDRVTRELRQQPTLRDAALRLLEMPEFVQLHELELARVFGLEAEMEPLL